MSGVMEGVRVLEVAHYTFVPSAGALLAEWGADVIKVEPPGTGDPQRGVIMSGGKAVHPDRNPLNEHANRGKRSIGLDISTAQGQQLVYELARTCDVFLTNYLPAARQKLKIDAEHIRAANPQIIYARGSSYGEKGADRDKGAYDVTAFWSRGGIAHTISPAELDTALMQGIQAFGDSISGMNLAGGIAAALFHRSQTGEARDVDVSLLSSAWWAAGSALAQAMESGSAHRNRLPRSGSVEGNPFIGCFRTSDGETISLCIMQPARFAQDVFDHLGLTDLKEDPRLADAKGLMTHWKEVSDRIAASFASQTFAHWRERLATMKGQWAPVLPLLDVPDDPQTIANDMLVDLAAADGNEPIRVVRGPVQFDGETTPPERSPQPFEHTESVLLELGLEWDRIERLKASGAIS